MEQKEAPTIEVPEQPDLSDLLEEAGIEALTLTEEEARLGLEILDQVMIPGRAVAVAASLKEKLEIVVDEAELAGE